LHIYATYVSTESPHHILLSDEIVHAVVMAISPEQGAVLPASFDAAQQQCMHTMQTHFFSSFRNSDIYSRFLTSELTSGNVAFEDVLLNDATFMVFMEYMERDGAVLLVQFWLSISNLRQQMADNSSTLMEQTKEDLEVLYRRFLGPQSPSSLPLDPYTRDESRALQSHVGTEDLFQWLVRPEHLVYTALQKFFFPAFLHSEMFYKFLNGLQLFNCSQIRVFTS
jgi:hypothetical protein